MSDPIQKIWNEAQKKANDSYMNKRRITIDPITRLGSWENRYFSK